MAVVMTPRAHRTERYTVRGMTCGSCERRIQQALGAVPGVATVQVDFRSDTALIEHDLESTPVERLIEAATSAGYVLKPATSDVRQATPGRISIRPTVIGILAASALLSLYLSVVTLAQGWQHATDLLAEDFWLVLPIMLGFGTQVGLFVHLRALSASASASGMAASTGTSTTAMLACCAHHLVDVLPILGLSGAALFLGAYKTHLLWLGLGMNLAGVAYLLWQLRRWRTRACCA